MTSKDRSRSAPLTAHCSASPEGSVFSWWGPRSGALVADWWWPLDLLTSFHPQYAVDPAGDPGSAPPGCCGARDPATWLLLAALVNASLVAPFLVGGRAGRRCAGGPTLSVLSFNVGVSNPNRREIAGYVGRGAAGSAVHHREQFRVGGRTGGVRARRWRRWPSFPAARCRGSR